MSRGLWIGSGPTGTAQDVGVSLKGEKENFKGVRRNRES